MLISDWSSDVCSSDLRLDHAFVEHLRLTGIEDPAHCEKMLERFLLQAAHHLVGLVDRLGDLLPIAMFGLDRLRERSEEHTSELQSLMRISYAVFCLKKKKKVKTTKSRSINNQYDEK